MLSNVSGYNTDNVTRTDPRNIRGNFSDDFVRALPSKMSSQVLLAQANRGSLSTRAPKGDGINLARMEAGMRPISSDIGLNKYLNDIWNKTRDGNGRGGQGNFKPGDLEKARNSYRKDMQGPLGTIRQRGAYL